MYLTLFKISYILNNIKGAAYSNNFGCSSMRLFEQWDIWLSEVIHARRYKFLVIVVFLSLSFHQFEAY